MVRQFDPSLLNKLSSTKEIIIETRSPAGTIHQTIIWVVVVDGNVYIRSVRGSAGRWYREIVANPHGAIHIAGQRVPIRAVPVSEEDTIALVSKSILEKYKGSPAAHSMVRSEILQTTLQLELDDAM